MEVEDTEGKRWVMKMRGAGNGVQSLVAELVVNRLAKAAGFPVPDASTIRIPEGFPWEFGTDEFDDIVKKSFGANLALEPIEGALPITAEEAQDLPPALLRQVVAIDAVFSNYDRTSRSVNLLRDATKQVWIVDHGSCLFLDKPIALPDHHLLKAREKELLGREELSALRESLLNAVR